LPHITVYHNLRLKEGGTIGWVVRKNNPKLKESLNAFLKRNRKGTLLGNLLYKQYFQNTKWAKNPIRQEHMEKLARYAPLCKKYGEQYKIDWRLIAAQAFQESGLDNTRKSRAGARGVMVAVALLPPLMLFGLVLGNGQLQVSLNALLLFATNVVCLNISAVAMFFIQGVRPNSWWKAEQAKKQTRIAIAVWLALLAVLSILIQLEFG